MNAAVLWRILALTGILWLVPFSTLEAQTGEQTLEGVVVHVDAREIFVALGSEQGLPALARVEVYRRVEVVHPNTREKLTDRFPIGEMELSEVGRVLSIGSSFGGLQQRPSVGDFVVYRIRPSRAPQPENLGVAQNLEVESLPSHEAEAPPSEPAHQSRPPELVNFHRDMEAAMAQPLSARIARWEQYLAQYPDSPHARLVDRELIWLRNRLMEERLSSQAVQQPAREERRQSRAQVDAPRKTFTDRPVHIVATLSEPDIAEEVRVLIKRDSQTHFEMLPMERIGDFHWRLAVDESWRSPGTLHYFVETVRKDGEIDLVAGSSNRPNLVVLEESVEVRRERENRSQANASFDFVNFNHGKGKDEFYRFESDFRYAIRGYAPLVAFRTGVGIYQGGGGRRDDIEAGEPSREMSVGYGYVDTEFAFHDLVSFSSRLVLGTGQATDRPTNYDTLGMRLQLRVGEEDGMRLIGGVSLTQEIGNEAWIEFIGHVLERVPLLAAVIVTNLPVGAELGVSLQGGIGYALTDRFALMARVGWNARTINYYGPSFGVGTVLNW